MSAGGTGAFPSLGVRLDAIGHQQAQQKVNRFSNTVRSASGQINTASQATKAWAVDLRQLSFSVFGLSLSVTTTLTSMSRLEKATLAVREKQVSYDRTVNELNRKQRQLNDLIREGGKGTTEYRNLVRELETGLKDLEKKTEDIRVAQKDVNDTYINFAASIASSVLFSAIGLKEALKGLNKAMVSNAIQMVTLRKTAVATSPALSGVTAATTAQTAATIKATFATQGLAAGMRQLVLSINPVTAAIGAAATIATVLGLNIGGSRDKLSKFLGIQKDSKDATDEQRNSLIKLSNIINKQKQNVIDLSGEYESANVTIKSTTDLLQEQVDVLEQAREEMRKTGDEVQKQKSQGGLFDPFFGIGKSLIPKAGAVGPGASTLGGEVLTGPTGGIGSFRFPFRPSRQLPSGAIPEGIRPFARRETRSFFRQAQQLLGGPVVAAFEQVRSIDRELESIVGRRKQILEARDQLRELLEPLKEGQQRQEAINLLRERLNREIEIGTQLQTEEGEKIANNAQLLKRQLDFVLNRLQAEKRVNDEIDKQEKKLRRVTPLFDFLRDRGAIGLPATIGRNLATGRAIFGGPSFGQGPEDLFSGFVGESITVGGRTFRSRRLNPNRGVTTTGGQNLRRLIQETFGIAGPKTGSPISLGLVRAEQLQSVDRLSNIIGTFDPDNIRSTIQLVPSGQGRRSGSIFGGIRGQLSATAAVQLRGDPTAGQRIAARARAAARTAGIQTRIAIFGRGGIGVENIREIASNPFLTEEERTDLIRRARQLENIEDIAFSQTQRDVEFIQRGRSARREARLRSELVRRKAQRRRLGTFRDLAGEEFDELRDLLGLTAQAVDGRPNIVIERFARPGVSGTRPVVRGGRIRGEFGLATPAAAGVLSLLGGDVGRLEQLFSQVSDIFELTRDSFLNKTKERAVNISRRILKGLELEVPEEKIKQITLQQLQTIEEFGKFEDFKTARFLDLSPTQTGILKQVGVFDFFKDFVDKQKKAQKDAQRERRNKIVKALGVNEDEADKLLNVPQLDKILQFGNVEAFELAQEAGISVEQFQKFGKNQKQRIQNLKRFIEKQTLSRQRFLKVAQNIIKRRNRFAEFLEGKTQSEIEHQVGAGGGTSLDVSTEFIEQAIKKVREGEDHRDFKRLVTLIKAR